MSVSAFSVCLVILVLFAVSSSVAAARPLPHDKDGSTAVNWKPHNMGNGGKGIPCNSAKDCTSEEVTNSGLHAVPSGPNPVGNSLPGKFLLHRSPPVLSHAFKSSSILYPSPPKTP